jgi:hypothetical protein
MLNNLDYTRKWSNELGALRGTLNLIIFLVGTDEALQTLSET